MGARAGDGPVSWDFSNDQDKAEVLEQSQQFWDENMDLFNQIAAKIAQYTQELNGDKLLMLAQVLGVTCKQIMELPMVVVHSGDENKN